MEKTSSDSSKKNTFTLKDSGYRTEFQTGAQRENAPGKGRFDLISPFMLKRLAVVMEKGARKYSERNWEKGMPMNMYLDSAMRHISQLLEGMSDEDHAGQAIFNLMAFIHTEEMVNRGILPKELNTLPNYGQTNSTNVQMESSAKSQNTSTRRKA